MPDSLLVAPLARLLAAHSNIRRLVVGYSGGLDSHVLLHVLATQRAAWPRRELQAVYIDHGLQAASAAWGAHCARICRALAVPWRIRPVTAHPAPGESPEAAARHARYAALAAELGPDVALLTAHHRDDQAETLLLQLLRGAGPHGLAAMPAAAPLGAGWLLRPWLAIERAALLEYGYRHALRWIEDASNNDIGFDRNYLRHRIMPLLQQRWPSATNALARSARWCAEAAAELDQQAAHDLAQAAGASPDQLSLAVLRPLSQARQRYLLRYWLRTLGLPIPGSRQLEQLRVEALSAAHDRQPGIRWPGGEVRRHRAKLYAMPPLALLDRQAVWSWRSDGDGYPPLDLPGLGRLRWQAKPGAGVRAALLADGATLTVRFRQGGEWLHLAGRTHHQELKKLLQAADIPPWQRDRTPLLYRDSVLIAVIGLGVAARWAAAPSELGWLPVLEAMS